ncbi:MAG: lipopolysaccharide transport periplasmic protein LptA [Gammaproteobacteria bacterium]
MSLIPAFLRALLLASAFCATASWAEKADRDKPINVESDRMQYDDVKQVSTFTGNVVLTKGTLEIRGDRLTVRTDPEGWQYGTAWGDPASFRQKREGVDEWIEGKARQIDYDGKQDTVRLQQQAMVRRTAHDRVLDEVHGSDILYESRTEFFTVEGEGGAGVTAANPTGRVRVIIQPRTTPAAPAGPPATLEPSPQLGPAGVAPNAKPAPAKAPPARTAPARTPPAAAPAAGAR